mgnify:CR=1 FL=1|jgi:hypothetical protein
MSGGLAMTEKFAKQVSKDETDVERIGNEGQVFKQCG